MADIDAPSPSASSPKPAGKGLSGFLTAETAGMPNWVWGCVLVVGIGLVFIVPRLRGTSSSGTTSATGTSNGTPSGVGMAIDPTSGLPYAVEGLVPSGAVAGGSSGQTSDLAALEAFLSQTLQQQQQQSPSPSDGGSNNGSKPPSTSGSSGGTGNNSGLWWLYPTSGYQYPSGGTPQPVAYPGGSPGGPPKAPEPAPSSSPRTQTVGSWPNWDGSLWGIAQHYYGNGSRWTDIYAANRGVIGSNPNVIRPGETLVIP